MDRSRLVKHGVPFIVPGKQMYLPPLGIDFRERFGRAPATKDHVGPAAQVLVLAYLYRLRWASSTPTEIAAEIGYSKMSIGRAFSEIQSAGLGKIRQAGKEKTLVFDVSGRALWEKTVGMLRNPITSVRHEERRGEVGREEVYLSGLSALSSYTDLAEPSTPIHAIWNRARSARAGGDTQSYEVGAQETIVERWAYNPAYFSEAGRVDRLSLYLSLRDSEDERVELALHHLLEGVDW
jgi:hypothetical protein